MNIYTNERIGRLVRFLVNLKADTFALGKDGRLVGNCDYLGAATNLDNCIAVLLGQQTEIEDLKNRLEAAREKNREYYRLAGDLEDLYPKTVEDSTT